MSIGTTNVGRGGGLATPIFNHDAGAALFTTVQDLFTKIGNSGGVKWAKAISLAPSASIDFVHDLDLPFAKINVQVMDTSTDNVPTWTFTTAATIGSLRNSVTIVNTSGAAQQINIQVSPAFPSAGGGGGSAVHAIGDQSYGGVVDGVKVVTGNVTLTGAFVHYGDLTIEGSLINDQGYDVTIWGDLIVTGAIISPPLAVDCNFTVHGNCMSGQAFYPVNITTTASGSGITDLGTAYQFDGWTSPNPSVPGGATTLLTFTTGPNTGITVPMDFNYGTSTYPGLTASAVAWTANVTFPNTNATYFDVVPKTAAVTKTIVTIDGDYYTEDFYGQASGSGFTTAQPAPVLIVKGIIKGKPGFLRTVSISSGAGNAALDSQTVLVTDFAITENCNAYFSSGNGQNSGPVFVTTLGRIGGNCSIASGTADLVSGNTNLVLRGDCNATAEAYSGTGGQGSGFAGLSVVGDSYGVRAGSGEVTDTASTLSSGSATISVKSVFGFVSCYPGKNASTSTGVSGNAQVTINGDIIGSVNCGTKGSNNFSANSSGKLDFVCKGNAALTQCLFYHNSETFNPSSGSRTIAGGAIQFRGDLFVDGSIEWGSTFNTAPVDVGSLTVFGRTVCNRFRKRMGGVAQIYPYQMDFKNRVTCRQSFEIEGVGGSSTYLSGDYKQYLLQFRDGITTPSLLINGTITTGTMTVVFGGTSHIKNFLIPTGNVNWRILPDGDLDPGVNPYPITNVQVPVLRIGEFTGGKKTLNRGSDGLATAAQAVTDTSGNSYTYSPNANAWIRSAAGTAL